MIGHVTRATADDARRLAAYLRPRDADEALALGYPDPTAALLEQVAYTTHGFTWSVHAFPAAMWGCRAASLTATSAEAWLVTSPLVERYRMTFLRHCRAFVLQMIGLYPHLYGYVDARYTQCTRWLAWLGFVLAPAAPHGPRGVPFHRFDWRT